MDNIEERVKRIISEQLGITESEIRLEQSLMDDLGADSLDEVELLMAIEDEFAFASGIPDDEAEKLTTVQTIVDYVRSQVSAKAT